MSKRHISFYPRPGARHSNNQKGQDILPINWVINKDVGSRHCVFYFIIKYYLGTKELSRSGIVIFNLIIKTKDIASSTTFICLL